MPINVLGLDELSELLTHQSSRTAKRWLLSCAAPAAVTLAYEFQNIILAELGYDVSNR